MGMPLIQPSFAAGELSPSLWARVDLSKYHVGAALLRNFLVDYRGGAVNRAGTMFVNQVKDSNNPVRLIPFEFSTEQTYVLEFGELYMRVVMDGAHVLETPSAITGASQAATCVITQVAHGYSTDDWVFIYGVGGMTQLNGKYYLITVLTANTYSLSTLNGAAIDSTTYSAYTAGGTGARVFTLTTPYAAADLATLKYVQSADVMTLTHKEYAPRDLTRTGHASWTLSTITFAPTQAAPNLVSTIPSTAGATGYTYKVTAISADGTEESLPSNAVNAASVPMSTTAGAYVTLTWTAPAGTQPSRYNIYRTSEIIGVSPPPAGSIYGYVGSAEGTALTFIDQNTLEDLTDAPPTAVNPFSGNNHPGCAAYFQQRRFYAGSTADPQSIWASRPACFNNMDTTFPAKDSDALVLSILSQQVNAIQFMVPLTDLLSLTKGGAWKISSGGSNSEALTPTQAAANPQVYNGCSEQVQPIIVGNDILYVQSKGSVVRDLAFNLYQNSFSGTDLTILANHLFQGYTIKDWTWCEEPYKMVWAVRNDGTLLGFTFLKEQEVYAWSRHDTRNGRFLSTTCIGEGDEDTVYFVIQRLIDGNYVQYIERMASRNFRGDVTEAWFVDCGLRYPLTYPSATATPREIDDWEEENIVGGVVEITTDAAVFAAGDVAAEKVIKVNGGRAVANTFVNAQTMKVQIIVPFVSRWPSPEGDWSYTTPVTELTGLDHLEGEEIAILGDGGVVGNQVVVGGRVPLAVGCTDITAGIPIQAQLQTLYINPIVGNGVTAQSKPMNINAVTVRVKDTRGLKIGSTFATVVPIKERTQTTPMGIHIPLVTGDERMPIDPNWKVGPQACFQQDEPLPAQILGVIPEVNIGG